MVPKGGGGGLQKTQKNAKNRLREISWFRPALRERSWRDLGVLWNGFWVIVWWFWVIWGINFNDFFVLPRLMIRATKYNSIDRVDLIICLAIWTLYKRRPPKACDDFRASCIASRNRFRSRPHFFATQVDLGRFSEARAEVQIDFREIFF